MNALIALILISCVAINESTKLSVDVTNSLTTAQIKCLKSNYTIEAIIARAYKPDNDGMFDDNCVGTINLANKESMTVEIYMTINPASSKKQGYDQVDELRKELKKHGFQFRRVWIKVTTDMNWASDIIVNQGMISQVLGRLRQFGYAVGIMTSASDWSQLTGSWTQAGSDVFLWYSNINGSGLNGETDANFNDFQSFGVSDTPTIKQYGIEETLCNVPLNRDCF